MARFEGNEFVNCSIPLAFEGRYFVLEPGTPDPLVSVVREVDGRPVFEVLKNEPVQSEFAEVSTTPAGIVTVGEKDSGRFLYKVRPGSETSIVFGTLQGDEIEARITDRSIKVGGITLENNVFNGVGAGVVVGADGSVSIGAPIPESFLRLFEQ